MQNRRNWLKSTLALTAGLPLSASLVQSLLAAPVGETEKNFWLNYPAAAFKIRLNANENPYGPSEKARKAVQEILHEGNRYPFDTVGEMKEILAKKEGVTPDHIALGSGSGELLCVAGVAFGLEGGSVLSGFPTFPMLMNYAEVFQARWDKVNLNENLEFDYTALASQIKHDTRLVFICNPNNPTGTLVDPKIVKSFCEEVSGKVTVYADEAYLEFLEPHQQVSMVDLVKQNKNVIVSRTFSKIYGLAGLRIGYVVAKPDLIRKMSRYGMSMPSQTAIAAAKASLGDDAFMSLTRNKNAEARQHLTRYLDKKKYFYGKSHTNFVFFEPKSSALQIMTTLADKGIGIRTWDYQQKQWCRISIGTLDEMNVLTKAFEEMRV
ncbi:MAG: histidinol-phosphate aminotransferase family protein [Cyclobacteriaceae bacterium]|nr:histidinol-phosphate aminotransferase family protein [Cyclobacteriaceae bacterium]